MSNDRLTEIAARAAAATPGPWQVERDEPSLSRLVCDEGRTLAIDFGYVGNNTQDDAEFTAHAREDVPWLLAQLKQAQRTDREFDTVMRERDAYHEAADALAYAVAPIEVIGEHSSDNCPWTNALDHVTPAAEVAALRKQLEQARGIAVELENENARQAAEQQTLVDRARRVAESHQQFIEDHQDPGTDALCAQYEIAQTLVRSEGAGQPEPGAEPEIPWATARHVLWTFGEDGGMRPGSFTQQLIDTCARGDVTHLARLAQAYPAEAHAVHLAKNTEDGIARLQAIAGGAA